MKGLQTLSTSVTTWALSSPPPQSTSTSYGMATGLTLTSKPSNTSCYLSLQPLLLLPQSLTGGTHFPSTLIKPAPTSPALSSSPANTPISGTNKFYIKRFLLCFLFQAKMFFFFNTVFKVLKFSIFLDLKCKFGHLKF